MDNNSSFYVDGSSYSTATVTSNDAPPDVGTQQAPSSFYQAGNVYAALSDEDFVAELQAATAAALAAAAAANAAALTVGASAITSVFGRTGVVVAASGDYTFAQIGSKPTTLAGYGITDTITNTVFGRSGAVVAASGDYTFAQIGSKPTSIAGYGILDTLTNTVFGRSGTVIAQSGDYTFAQIGAKPTTISGYGITDTLTNTVFGRSGAVVAATGDYTVAQITGAAPLASPALTGTPTAPTATPGTNTTQIATTAFVLANVGGGAVSSVFGRTGAVVAATNDYTFAQIGSKPTTVAGYGITDTLTNTVFGRSGTVVAASGDYTFAQIGSKPTTISGYGITDTLTNTVFGRSGTVVAASGDYTVAQITGAAPLASPAFTGDITLTGTSSGAVGPTLSFIHNSVSPATNDQIAYLKFLGNNSSAVQTQYGEISAVIRQPNAGAEYGHIRGQVMCNGTLSDTLVGAETFLLGYQNPASNNFEYVFRAPAGKISYMYLESVDGGATGPSYNIWHNSPTPAVNDIAGAFVVDGQNSAAAYQNYTRIDTVITNATSGSATSDFRFYTATAGALSEKMRLDGNGYLTIGGYANVFGALHETIADPTVKSTGAFTAIGANAGGSTLFFLKTRAAAPTTQTIVASGDVIGSLAYKMSDGTAYQYAAQFSAEVDGTPGAGSTPGRFVWKVTPSGSTTPVEGMRLSSAGTLTVGSFNVTTAGVITGTAATAAVDTNTTQLATTAFVLAQAASATPLVDGTAAVGTSTRFARGDHVHPTDTSRAALASPTFTGTPAAPTAAVSTNTTQLATTAFVLGQLATVAPLMDGTAAVGTSLLTARQDHVHPTDTTRAALASPALTGTPTAPTAAVSTNTTQIASTAFVLGQLATVAPLINGTAAVGTSLLMARQDHVHPTDTTRAALASPTFTGVPAAPTAAVDTNTTQIATTAMVLAQAASATPLIAGTAAVGTSTRFARGDHVHPTEIDNTAWNSSAITVVAGAGTLTTVSGNCRWKQIGKNVFFNITITITTNGTGSSFIRSSNLPFTPVAGNAQAVAGYIPQIGCGLAATLTAGSPVITIFKFDASYPGANGNVLICTGVCEVA